MSEKDPNNVNAYHNQGEKDASDGKYEPPNSGFLYEAIGRQEHEQDQLDAYNAGYDNTKSQEKDD